MKQMIPGGMYIDEDPSEDEIPSEQVIDPDNIDFRSSTNAPLPSFSQGPIVVIHDQAIQPDPGIQNNDILELEADQNDQIRAADIISAAFLYNQEFQNGQFFIDEHKKDKHLQDNENNIPTAKSAMGRWVFPILYESIKGIALNFANERGHDKEQKIIALKDQIKKPLVQKLASNYCHGWGSSSYFKGPIGERTWPKFLQSFWWNLKNPMSQHGYTDPVLKMTLSSHGTPNEAQAEKNKFEDIKTQTIWQTQHSVVDVGEPKFTFRQPPS